MCCIRMLAQKITATVDPQLSIPHLSKIGNDCSIRVFEYVLLEYFNRALHMNLN